MLCTAKRKSGLPGELVTYRDSSYTLDHHRANEYRVSRPAVCEPYQSSELTIPYPARPFSVSAVDTSAASSMGMGGEWPANSTVRRALPVATLVVGLYVAASSEKPTISLVAECRAYASSSHGAAKLCLPRLDV